MTIPRLAVCRRLWRLARAIALTFALLPGRLALPALATEPAATSAPATADSPPATTTADQEAAKPLAADKHEYIYLEAWWQDGLNYAIQQHLLSVYAERKRRYGFAEDALLTGRIGIRIAADAAGYIERDGLDRIEGDVRNPLRMFDDSEISVPSVVRVVSDCG